MFHGFHHAGSQLGAAPSLQDFEFLPLLTLLEWCTLFLTHATVSGEVKSEKLVLL